MTEHDRRQRRGDEEQHDRSEDPDRREQHRGPAAHGLLAHFLAPRFSSWSPSASRPSARSAPRSTATANNSYVRAALGSGVTSAMLRNASDSRPPPRARRNAVSSSSTTTPRPRATTRCTACIGPAPVRTWSARSWLTVGSSRRIRSARCSIARSTAARARVTPQNPAPNATARVPTGARSTTAAAVPPTTAARRALRHLAHAVLVDRDVARGRPAPDRSSRCASERDSTRRPDAPRRGTERRSEEATEQSARPDCRPRRRASSADDRAPIARPGRTGGRAARAAGVGGNEQPRRGHATATAMQSAARTTCALRRSRSRVASTRGSRRRAPQPR